MEEAWRRIGEGLWRIRRSVLDRFSVDFRGARLFLTSKSSSSRFVALDGQIFRSVRRLGLIFRFFTARTSTCGGKARVTEIPEGDSAPPDPPGARHG